VREPAVYRAILQAIGAGHHTPKAIGDAGLISQAHLSAYLNTLQELRLVKRRLPATLTAAQQRKSRQGRYHLSDPYLRFYFRFLAPHLDDLVFTPDQVLNHIQQEIRAFVGQTIFEELAQTWLAAQGRQGGLPFKPQAVGQHWSRRVQVDAVAVNWDGREILLGECKWGTESVSRQAVRELIEGKTAKVVNDLGAGEWRVHYAFFARAGFTAAATELLQEHNGLAISLTQLDDDLARA
jgi:uncharacterized protein